MYELDDLIYYKDHIVGSTYSLCGFNYGNSIYISGYRHKYYKNIKCFKCREIYKWIKDNEFNNYNEFMSEFRRYYNSDLYSTNEQLYNDFKNNKIDLNTGISSYSKEMRNIIDKVYIDNYDIDFLKQSKEVKNINIEESISYNFKSTDVKFELLHGDKIFKQTKNIYLGGDNYVRKNN